MFAETRAADSRHDRPLEDMPHRKARRADGGSKPEKLARAGGMVREDVNRLLFDEPLTVDRTPIMKWGTAPQL